MPRGKAPEDAAAAPLVKALRPVPRLLGALADLRPGPGPANPVHTAPSWALLAAASREISGAASTGQVIAIPKTPLFTALRLQEIPIIGPLLVTPLVRIVNRIPIVSDLLHPIFGYPLLPDGYVTPRDVRVVSFDGTKINVHLLPASGLLEGQTAPTVLWGSPIGMPAATNLNGTPLDLVIADFGGVVSVAAVREAGYNVVTWDPRGEYCSGGLMQIDSPDYEARDMSTIISWLADQPTVQLDSPGDPAIGMVGASYGGSIQPVTAATDHRVDAIVPSLAWNTLNTSYYPNNAFKSSQGVALAATLMLTLTRTNPHILPALILSSLTGRVTPRNQELLAERGPGSALGFPDLVAEIIAPTLLIQGTIDPAFSLAQADLTATTLLAQSVPTKVIWFCGGHGLCMNKLFDPDEGALIEQRTLAWLDRYVRDEAVSTGPGFEWFDQNSEHLSTETYGGPSGEPIVASNTGRRLPLIPILGGSAIPVLLGATKALNAVNLRTPAVTTTTYVATVRLVVGLSGELVAGFTESGRNDDLATDRGECDGVGDGHRLPVFGRFSTAGSAARRQVCGCLAQRIQFACSQGSFDDPAYSFPAKLSLHA